MQEGVIIHYANVPLQCVYIRQNSFSGTSTVMQCCFSMGIRDEAIMP